MRCCTYAIASGCSSLEWLVLGFSRNGVCPHGSRKHSRYWGTRVPVLQAQQVRYKGAVFFTDIHGITGLIGLWVLIGFPRSINNLLTGTAPIIAVLCWQKHHSVYCTNSNRQQQRLSHTSVYCDRVSTQHTLHTQEQLALISRLQSSYWPQPLG